nr:hypothetical protein [uncultured Carboxylicivirga sp.]
MKKWFLTGKLLACMSLLLLASCDDDEKSWTATTDPVLTFASDNIHSQPGRTLTIGGTVTDEVGLKSIEINIDEWFLDKTIEVYKGDEVKQEFDLGYKFLVPADSEDKEFIIKVTVTNLGGRTTTKDLSVFMDGDFENPTLDVTSPADGLTVEPSSEQELTLSAKIEDARQLGYIVVEEPTLAFYDSISFMGQGLTSYEYASTVTLPAEVAEYSFTFSVADSAGLVVNATRGVSASYVYAKMYLADVATDAELVSDLFGVPMLIKTTGTNVFQAEYYSAVPNTEVKFIPQTSSFAPHCFGIDPANSEKFIDSQDALPVVLPEVGYYRINFDLNDLSYSVEKFTPDYWYYESRTESTDDDYISSTWIGELGIVGKGFPEYDQNWGTGNPITFDRDPDNLYVFTKTLDLYGDVEMIFSPQHPWGWWPEPFWRFDNGSNPETTKLNGGNNISINVPTRTRYTITFDSYLNRVKAVKVE